MDWRGQSLLDGHGGPVKIVAAGRDVTARRERTARLAEQSALLRAVLDNLPVSIYTKDRDGRYILNNATNVRLLGAASEEELRGKSAFDFFPPEVAASFADDDRHVFETGQGITNREEPLVDPRTGRSRWFLTTKVALTDAAGSCVGRVGISRDITDAKLQEQQTQQSQKIHQGERPRHRARPCDVLWHRATGRGLHPRAGSAGRRCDVHRVSAQGLRERGGRAMTGVTNDK